MARALAIIAILAGYVAMDVLSAARLWLLIRPVRRLKSWRKRRRMQSWADEHGGPPDEILEPFNSQPDEDFMSEAQLSFLRGVLKVLAGALVAKGIVDVGDSAALQATLEALAAAVVGGWAFWQSHRKHTQG